jgi:hypothetical protein
MTPDDADRTTAAPPAGQSAPPARLRLDPTLAGRGVDWSSTVGACTKKWQTGGNPRKDPPEGLTGQPRAPPVG